MATSPLDSVNALTSWETVQGFAGAKDEDMDNINRLINGSSLLLNSLTNRKLKARALTEYYDGDGSDIILLRERPCNSVTYLYDDPERSWGATTVVTSTDYTVITEEGKIIGTGTSFSTGYKVLKIIYNGGLSAIPMDLEMTCVELVSYWYNKFYKAKVGIKSVTNEGRSMTYIDDIPQIVYTVAEKYRKYWVG